MPLEAAHLEALVAAPRLVVPVAGHGRAPALRGLASRVPKTGPRSSADARRRNIVIVIAVVLVAAAGATLPPALAFIPVALARRRIIALALILGEAGLLAELLSGVDGPV